MTGVPPRNYDRCVDAGRIAGVIIFGVPLFVVVFSVVRGWWRVSRGDFEAEAGGSYGRQFGRRRRKT